MAGNEIIALILSGCSLLVAAIALYVSWRNQMRIVSIEETREKDRQLEKTRAYLKAQIKEEERKVSGSIAIHRTHYLVIENEGSGEAHDINLQLNNEAVCECDFVQQPSQEIRTVGPRSSFRYELQGHARHLPLEISIAWKDNSGEGGDYRTTLTQ